MTTPKEPVGLDRRQLLKRSAIAGGTLLWMAPTVQTITARAAFASDGGPGDGSDLCADYYLLLIRCGFAYYLVKVTHETKPFKVIGGRQLWLEDDKERSKPGNHHHETDVSRLLEKYNCQAELPAEVVFYTTNGNLCLDVGRKVKASSQDDDDHDGDYDEDDNHGKKKKKPTAPPPPVYENACSIVTWAIKKGSFYATPITARQYWPQPNDHDHPNVFCFPVITPCDH